MAKFKSGDAVDTKTVDMLGEPKRGRGRPVDPNKPGRTSAERMRALRARRLEEGVGFATFQLPLELIARLDEFVQFKDLNKDEVVEKLIRNQLLRKR